MDIFTSYDLIIAASVIIILSFFFGEISRKTNIPSVLMLIVLGIGLAFALKAMELNLDFSLILEVLGIIGLIMIVLEAALELKLKRDKYIPIAKAMGIALVGLMVSTWVAAEILQYAFEMETRIAWLYATPLSILSSAIIIPSVSGLNETKREFHIYESTFSDILGIMLFYFLSGQVDTAEHGSGIAGFAGNLVLTVVVSVIASYLLILIFQNIRSHVKLFLLIAVLLLLYSLGKQMHLSSLIIILIFGLLIANMHLFFKGRLSKWLNLEKAEEIYEGLHVITMETAFVVRTFFFVIFGITIELASLANLQVALVSGVIILSIYLIRYIILRISVGKDLIPQLYIAPRGLITILLFYAIPENVQVENFEAGILLFIIIATSLVMTFALIYDKRRANQAVKNAKDQPVGYLRWKAPSVSDVKSEAQD